MKQVEKYQNSKKLLPYIVDMYPEKAQYLSGQDVKIIVQIKNPARSQVTVTAFMIIAQLETIVYQDDLQLQLEPSEEKSMCFTYGSPQSDWEGYGVDITLNMEGRALGMLSTAFDVVSSWKKAIRYGFLCDFYEKDEEDTSDVEQMAKFHLNAVQFYDWMYKHEDLVPKTDYFIDPLDRKLSLRAVGNKLEVCHKYGMKALAYGAVYGASYDFYKTHEEWALLNNDGKTIGLGGNWLIIMNTSPDSPWSEHIVNEYKKAVEEIGFDGIQLDTYGYPKKAYSTVNGQLKLERLDTHFPGLINTTREVLEKSGKDVGLIFNAVNNWPVDTVAAAALDAVYIEVWDPNDRYVHIQQIIRNAREKGRKPVILAAYLKAFAETGKASDKQAENCFLLASAAIFANGGYHILLGEYNGLLTEGYFVRYAEIHDKFVRNVRNYYDFIVRYAKLLYAPELEELTMTHSGGINDEFLFTNVEFSTYGEPDKVWVIIKEKPGYTVINLINLTGIKSDKWNEGKKHKPVKVSGIHVEALILEKVKGVFIASPEVENGVCSELKFEYIHKANGKYVSFDIPQLMVWDLVFIKT